MRVALSLGIVVALAGAPAGYASASVYKCAGENRQPIYQDSPCPPGKELRNFDTDPVEITVLPMLTTPEPAPRAPAAKPAKPAPPVERAAAAPKGPDPAERRFIHPGMTDAEVTAKIGPPDMTGGAKGRRTARWSYLPAPGDPKTITTILFDNGKVMEVERKVVP